MWNCKRCNEEVESDFDVCWNCGAQSDGKITEGYEEFKKNKQEIEKSNAYGSISYTSSYTTSIIIAKIISFVGWFIILISIITIIAILVNSSKSNHGLELIGLLPIVFTIISGLFLVMSGQITRAVIDNTNNTGKMLMYLKEISRK